MRSRCGRAPVAMFTALLALTTAEDGRAQAIGLPDARWKILESGFEPGEGSAPIRPPASSVEGRRGRALRLGRSAGTPEWIVPGVVDLARPGAITCWIRPSAWQPPGAGSEYVPVLRVLGAGSAALIVERDRRSPGRTVDVWIAGFFSLASRSDLQMQLELPSLWSDDDWHFLAFQWDATGFALQLDQSPPARTAVPGANLAADFPKSTSKLVFGAGEREGLALDDLTIWSRPLERRELEAIRAERPADRR